MKKLSILLCGLLLITSSTFAIETGRFGPQNSQGATLTLSALGGAGSSGQYDRYCFLNITLDPGTAYGPGNASACVFTIASAGSTLYAVGISTAAPAPIILNFSPPAYVGSTGYGMCGTRGATVTITAANCGTNYDINVLGYTDR